jgi:hypothetical protein
MSSTVERAHLPAPDEAIIVIRDVAGFFADCGCAGEMRGGLGRARAATLGAPNVKWLFVGRLVMPEPENMTSSQLEANRANAAALVKTTSALLASLGKEVYWVPHEREMEFLEAAGADTSLLKSFEPGADSRLRLGRSDVEVRGNAIELSGLSAKIQLPRPDNRARDIVVLAHWSAGADGPVEFRRDIGALIPAATGSRSVTAEILSRLESRQTPIATSWRSNLHASMASEAEVDGLLSAQRIALVHQWQGAATLPGVSMSGDVAEAWKSCASCHEAAYKAWLNSPHVHAYETLARRGSHRRPHVYRMPYQCVHQGRWY